MFVFLKRGDQNDFRERFKSTNNSNETKIIDLTGKCKNEGLLHRKHMKYNTQAVHRKPCIYTFGNIEFFSDRLTD